MDVFINNKGEESVDDNTTHQLNAMPWLDEVKNITSELVVEKPIEEDPVIEEKFEEPVEELIVENPAIEEKSVEELIGDESVIEEKLADDENEEPVEEPVIEEKFVDDENEELVELGDSVEEFVPATFGDSVLQEFGITETMGESVINWSNLTGYYKAELVEIADRLKLDSTGKKDKLIELITNYGKENNLV